MKRIENLRELLEKGAAVTIVTHSDLDGIASEKAMRVILGKSKVFVKDDYSPVSSKTLELFKESLEENKDYHSNGGKHIVCVFDREINHTDAQEILDSGVDMLLHIDHHPSNTKYTTEEHIIGFYGETKEDRKLAACELVMKFTYKFLLDLVEQDYKNYNSLYEIINYCGSWDTFRWNDLEGDNKQIPVILSSAEKLTSPQYVFRILKQGAKNGLRYELNEKTKSELITLKLAFDFTLDSIIKDLKYTTETIKIDDIEFKYMVVKNLDSKYYSLVANKILNDNPDIHFMANLFDFGSIGFRGSKFDPVLDFSVISKNLPGSGGGHPKAAGGHIYKDRGRKMKDRTTEKCINAINESIISYIKSSI
ncbi:MAG: hypothetical protein ACRC92_20460 [Peptostreptococcaceae bacterium]